MSELRGLKEILQGEVVVDVQCVESLAESVYDPIHSWGPELERQFLRRVAVIDKLSASRMILEAGIRAPEAIPVADISPEQVAQKFGFPVVVKERIGYGGGRGAARPRHGRADAATPSESGDTGHLFYEQFITGSKLDYAAVVGPTGIEQELAYHVSRWKLPVGRATEIETIDDPRLVTFGRRVLDVIGCIGFVNMDIIRDEQGEDWVIDVNPRAFGGCVGFMAAGIELSSGYLKSIGLRGGAPPVVRTPRPEVQFPVFPTCLEDSADSGRIVPTSVAFLRDACPYLTWLGLRYWLSEALEVAFRLRQARLAHRKAVAPHAVAT